MQKAHATHYSAQCTARKARLLRGLIMGRTVQEALALLSVGRRAGAHDTSKLIKSALAQLPFVSSAVPVVVADLVVNEGPRRRMFMPRAQGRAAPILKKTSHLTVHLELQKAR